VVSIRHFTDWLSDSTSDPRGLVMLGRRDPRSTWWLPVIRELPPPALLDDRAVLPMVSGHRLDPDVVPRSRLAEDAGRISPCGVSPMDHDIGAPRSLQITADSGLSACPPWTTSAGR
jgi:hypothetical protein